VSDTRGNAGYRAGVAIRPIATASSRTYHRDRMRERRRWPGFVALVLAALLALFGSFVWTVEDSPNLVDGRSTSSGHGASLIVFVIAAVIGLIAILRIVSTSDDDEPT
jgi:uncharacterized membrane protein HdeD (DUF308 family)